MVTIVFWTVQLRKYRKVDFELAARLFPFSGLSHFQKHKAQLWTTPGSAACRLVHYTKEILKNTKEKTGNRIFPFFAHETILLDI